MTGTPAQNARLALCFSVQLRALIAFAVFVGLIAPASAQKITIAVVPSVPGGTTYVACDKGYFRDAGLDVDIERIDSLGRMAWQSRTPNGDFNVASVLDVQGFFQREGTIHKTSPDDKLVDTSYAADVAKELGPFELINKASPLKGSR